MSTMAGAEVFVATLEDVFKLRFQGRLRGFYLDKIGVRYLVMMCRSW